MIIHFVSRRVTYGDFVYTRILKPPYAHTDSQYQQIIPTPKFTHRVRRLIPDALPSTGRPHLHHRMHSLAEQLRLLVQIHHIKLDNLVGSSTCGKRENKIKIDIQCFSVTTSSGTKQKSTQQQQLQRTYPSRRSKTTSCFDFRTAFRHNRVASRDCIPPRRTQPSGGAAADDDAGRGVQRLLQNHPPMQELLGSGMVALLPLMLLWRMNVFRWLRQPKHSAEGWWWVTTIHWMAINQRLQLC